MQFFRDTKNLKTKFASGSVITIGNYDGIHLGHQKILSAVAAKARALKLPSVVIIFEPQPEEFFTPHANYSRLTSLREKLIRLAKFNIANVLCLRFNKKFAAFTAEQFVKKILVDALNIRYLIVGDDFVFGKDKQGDFALLQKLSTKNNFQAAVVPQVKLNSMRVSSTLIRAALQLGDLKTAAQFLGRPYTLFGRVVHGAKRGRDLGFPTANIYLPHKILPISGVYAVKIHFLNGKDFFGIANVGSRPTIGDAKKILEVYIFGFNADIYGEKIEIEFVQKIRDEKKFPSFALLQQQIASDVLQTKQFFNNI
jgi:riboflavin kinase / FMN adenylyltransferase